MSANGNRFSKMSIDERIKVAEKIFILHPQLKKILTRFSECHKSFRRSVEPQCLFLTAPTGAGKTTVATSYVAKFPRRVTERGTVIRVLTSVVPAIPGVKSIATRLLYDLGVPNPSQGSIDNQTYRLFESLADRGVEMIILDEIQHVYRIDRRQAQIAVDWLKSLVVHTGVPMVAMGTPESDDILHANDQFARRFSRMILEPFGWGPEEQENEFRTFLGFLDEMLPLDSRSGLSSRGTALRIHHATKGVVGDVMVLVRKAAILALQEGAEKITLDHLTNVYEERWGVAEKARMGSGRQHSFRTDVQELAEGLRTMQPIFKMTTAAGVRIRPKRDRYSNLGVEFIDVVRTAE